MNVFMPYLNSEDSVQALDNKRLCKQILECMQLIKLIEQLKYDHKTSDGYINHPVTQYYKNEYNFLVCYAFDCCLEYTFRYGKKHTYEKEISTRMLSIPKNLYVFTPSSIFYHEGSDIREYDPELSTEKFRNKLSKKWINDIMTGHTPQWKDRVTPSFFIDFIKTRYEELEELAQDFSTLKEYIKQYKEN